MNSYSSKKKKYLLFILVVVLFCFNEAKAFDYSEIKSGDSYESVKNFLFERGDKVIAFNETSMTTEYGVNATIKTIFKFKKKRLCEVRTDYGEREFEWILSDFDLNIRKYGTPIKMEPKGKGWDGFRITWQKDKQILIYDVGEIIPTGINKTSRVKSIATDKNICD